MVVHWFIVDGITANCLIMMSLFWKWNKQSGASKWIQCYQRERNYANCGNRLG